MEGLLFINWPQPYFRPKYFKVHLQNRKNLNNLQNNCRSFFIIYPIRKIDSSLLINLNPVIQKEDTVSSLNLCMINSRTFFAFFHFFLHYFLQIFIYLWVNYNYTVKYKCINTYWQSSSNSVVERSGGEIAAFVPCHSWTFFINPDFVNVSVKFCMHWRKPLSFVHVRLSDAKGLSPWARLPDHVKTKMIG